MVSSDALDVGGGHFALITYWENRSPKDLDFYRCVDITDSSFATVRQTCWKALRPTGNGPATISDVTSSSDICGQPETGTGAEGIAFCTLSRSFVVDTPYFEIALSPFEHGGLVAIRERGRHLLVADTKLPASVLLELRASDLATNPELSGITATQDFVGRPPPGFRCSVDDLAGRKWAECQREDGSASVAEYLVERGTVYQVGFDADVSAADRETIQIMIQSIRPKSP